MCIDLGGETSIKCKECGMEYVPSNEEDDGLHRDWHGMHVGGVDLGKGFVKEGFLRVVEGLGHGERIVLVERGSVLGAKRKARKVLDVVSRELGAVDIADEELWGSGPGVKAKKKNVGEKNQGKEDRFKMVLYLMGEKCVGLCLAERISHASKVVGAENDTSANMPAARSSSILTGPSTDPAILGISRIWTSTSHREKGIATALLDCARGHFFYGVEVPKDMVAFSQPTESGGRLAERWFGQRTGWHVYADDGGQRVQEEGC
jgi:N-acetyltransferase